MSKRVASLSLCLILFSFGLTDSSAQAQSDDSASNDKKIELVSQSLAPTKAKIERPRSWFYSESHRGPTLVWIISAEDSSGGTPYVTGVRIQSIRGIKKITGRSGAEFAQQQIAIASKKQGISVLSISETKAVGAHETCSLETQEGDNQVHYQFYWGTDELDHFVAVVSGAPKNQWDDSKVILNKISQFDPKELLQKHADVPSGKIPSSEALFQSMNSLGYKNVTMEQEKSGHMILPVRINGGEEMRFLCDSGANVSAVTPSASKLLNLEPKPTGSTISGVSGESKEAYRAAIKTFHVGSRSSNLSSIMVLDLDQLNKQLIQSGSEPVEGILGSEWMRAHGAVIDVANRRLFFKDDNRD